MGKGQNPRYEKHQFPYESIEAESEKGAKVRFSDEKVEWLPKSQIEIHDNIEMVEMPAWLAEDKGLM